MSDIESKRQDIAGRLVGREVFYCVSSLMYSVGQHIEEASRIFDEDYDSLIEMFQRPDYESAVDYFIEQDADLDDLEKIADECGWWSDVIEPYHDLVQEFETDEDTIYFVRGDGETYDDRDDAEDRAVELNMKAIRHDVWMMVATPEQYQWVCEEFNLDYDYYEVYEHWIVSNWLARRLKDEGEIVGDFAGLTIWGRCATGQAIALDGVIRKIAADLWPEEWNGDEQ